MLTLLKWVIGLSVLVLWVWWAGAGGVRRDRDGRTLPTLRPAGLAVGFFLFVATLLLLAGVGQIPAGTRGVVLRFGAPTSRILPEGIYLITPGVESVVQMSVQTEAYEADATAASNDLQVVHTKVTLNYALDPAQVVKVYTNLRQEYVQRIIKPAMQEAVKASTARFRAEELITRREAVKAAITEALRTRLLEHGITVDTVSLTDFDFSDEFTKAIESKVTATQLTLKAERDLQRIKLEAQQQIERAKAEAEALRVQKQQVTRELVDLRRIEAQMRAIEKWDGRLPQVVTGSGPVPLLDVFKPQPERP